MTPMNTGPDGSGQKRGKGRKRVLVLRHMPHEHLGSIAPTLRRNSVAFEYLDLRDDPGRIVDLDIASALIIMGGPMSANDPYSYIVRELQLIEEALKRGLPLLGVCLGAQLIAKAAGSRVYSNAAKEIGWFLLHLTAHAPADPLFRHFEETETVFQWHAETFDLPAGAVWLARSEACPHQAYRLGTNVYGMQFHIELDAAMIAAWLEEDAACGDRREVTAPIDPKQNDARVSALCDRAVTEWIRFFDAGGD
jgi:GMP synthase (glutamine-hydrolysing)